MISVQLVGDGRSLSAFADEKCKETIFYEVEDTKSTKRAGHERARKIHLVDDGPLDDVVPIPHQSLSRKKKYKLPGFATKVVRRKGESIQSFLLRSLGSQVVKFGLSYLGKNDTGTELGRFLFLLEMNSKMLQVAHALEDEHADELQGYVFDTSQFWEDMTTRLAPFVFEKFDRAKYDDMSRRGAAAGRLGTKYDDLAGYLQTAHLSVAAAARALGISRPTVYKMRREYADLNTSTGEIHEAKETTVEPQPVVPDRLRRTTRGQAAATSESVDSDEPGRGPRPHRRTPRAGGNRKMSSGVEQPRGPCLSPESVPNSTVDKEMHSESTLDDSR